ncbi:PRD domain-containing protein [Klebsiella pneumoniae]|nr:PRD domain-containing protein [Klebsiella pneumoniae]
MNVIRILSNNAVLFRNENGEECVALGKGIGFNKKFGDELDASLIDNQFVKRGDSMTDTFLHILSSIPPACLSVAEDIVELARKELRFDENEESLFLALSDHIHYAVKRHKKGEEIKNLMLNDIKCFYGKEYATALKALALMNTRLKTTMPDDEAGFIALHFANACNQSQMKETMRSAKVIKDVLSILEKNDCIIHQGNSLNYNRIVTHLKYLSIRVFSHGQTLEQDTSIYDEILERMPTANSIAVEIDEYFRIAYDVKLTHDEKIFLTLHVNRLLQEQNSI